MVRDIKPEMCIVFLDTKQGCSSKTISAYKNAIEKIAIACSYKFHIDNFYTDAVRQHKVADTHKSNSKRVYTNEQIEQIYNYKSDRQAEIKCMCFLGCRVFELIGIKAEKFVIQRHLSHSSERQDLKKIYLYS